MSRVTSPNACPSSRRAEQARAREAERARQAAAEAAARAAAQAAQASARGPAPSPSPSPAPAQTRAAREAFARGCSTTPNERRLATPSASSTPTRGLDRGAAAGADHAVDRAAEQGAARLQGAADRLAAARTDDEKRDAARAATAAVRDVVTQAKDPATRQAILGRSQDALRTIGAGLDTLSRAETKAALQDLSAAAEAAGPAHVDALARPLARGMPAFVAGHGKNRDELTAALQDNVKAGAGTLLGAALGRQLRGVDAGLARDVGGAVGRGLGALREDFAKTATDVAARDGELAAMAQQWGATLSPDQLQAGTRAFQREHGEYARRDTQAAALAKALAGVGYADQHRMGGPLGEEGGKALGQLPELARSDAGARAIGAALVQESRGQTTFLRPAGDDPQDARGLQEAIQRAIVVSQGDALARGDTRGLVGALQGAGTVLQEPSIRERFQSFAREVQSLPAGLTPDKLAVGIARSAHGVAGQLSSAAAARLTPSQVDDAAVALADKTSFRTFGAALGAVALGQSLYDLRDGADAREAVGAVVGAAGLGSSVAGLVLKNGAPQLLSKGLPVVGYALSAFDTISALKKGDELGAVAAAAPLAGALSGAAIGAATGSFAPGVGTAIGGAVGALIGVGITAGRSLLSDSPSETFEKSTAAFLQGALQQGGLSAADAERAAHRLRDVNDDFFGAGPAIAAVAARTGETPTAVLQRLTRLDDEQLQSFVKRMLAVRDNGDAVRAAQAKVADGKAQPDAIPAFRLNDADVAALVDVWRAAR
jgi:hypothetical protein